MAAAAEYSSFQLAGKLLKVAMTLFYPGAKCIWWLIWTIVLLLAVRHFQPYALLTFVYPHQLVFKPDYWPVEMDTEPHNLLTPAAPPSLPPSSSSLLVLPPSLPSSLVFSCCLSEEGMRHEMQNAPTHEMQIQQRAPRRHAHTHNKVSSRSRWCIHLFHKLIKAIRLSLDNIKASEHVI